MKRAFLPVFFILVIVLVFFWRLFYPEPKLFYTVEIIGSDIWNVYYPMKHFLSQSLKSGQLPFWSKDIGTGLPVFAEGQIGVFFLPNLALYAFLPTWLAWNLSFVVTFFLLFLGSYLFFRKLGISQIASLFSAFSFSFGGYFVARVIHIAPLQTASLLPWVFLVGVYLWEKPTRWRVLLLAFVVSQQIYAGHMQWVLITLIGFAMFTGFHLFERRSIQLRKRVVVIAFAILFGFALAAPQILQTLELRQNSTRRDGLSQEEIFVFPYGIRNLVTFVFPEYYGTPRDGTYSADPSLGLFWENTAYIGVLPLFFLWVTVFSGRKRPWEWFFIGLGVLSLLLSFGRASPLYFLLTLPGFNNFRVVSRFLLLTTFAFAVLAGSGLDRTLTFISQRIRAQRAVPIIGLLFLLVAVGDVFRFAYPYHALVPVSEALGTPEMASHIAPRDRIWTDLAYLEPWKKVYLKQGWRDSEPFLYLRNSLYGNLSLVFDRTNIRPLAGLVTRRQEAYGSVAPLMLDASAVKYVVSPSSPAGADDLELVATVDYARGGLPTLYLSSTLNSLERVRFVSGYRVAGDLSEAVEIVKKGDFPFTESVILETDPGESFAAPEKAEIAVLEDRDQRMVLRTNTDKKAILVVADSFYPAWKATINGKWVEILPANINQRAVIVPAGDNMIIFSYYPKQFFRGLKVSGASVAAFAVLAFVRPERFLRKGSRKRLR